MAEYNKSRKIQKLFNARFNNFRQPLYSFTQAKCRFKKLMLKSEMPRAFPAVREQFSSIGFSAKV